ncbi:MULTISPECIES: SRPBCC family protein [Paenibacillus]|uniref:DUF1857 domain-containing protein n=1 Tax=Paenibacillus odorifer TaxID=189426 RepID=A0ABX3GYH5_9BACL|nr:SRPBCC family protein [Paenibacillus odorifer]OMD40576.1 hypothetical protein BSO21_00850 [Paenibacillus odorifer]
MFTVSSSIPVNNSTKNHPVLDRHQVWQGLVMKAEDATRFVGAITECTVVEKDERSLLREVVLYGERMNEQVNFFPEQMIVFEPLGGPTKGFIKNEIEEDEHGNLSVRFTFTFELRSGEQNKAAEKEFSNKMEKSYIEAVETTLSSIREMVTVGAL